MTGLRRWNLLPLQLCVQPQAQPELWWTLRSDAFGMEGACCCRLVKTVWVGGVGKSANALYSVNFFSSVSTCTMTPRP
ncbi:hypothetical protein SRHO_G00050370 [Serrasalmus rhombeus]